MNIEFSYNENDIDLEKSSFFSVVSIAQRSEFFKNYSWRLNIGSDRNYIDNNKSTPTITMGGGFSWGNDIGYIYFLADPFAYMQSGLNLGIGSSLGFVIDKYDWMSTNIELTSRIYENEKKQNLINISQNFKLSQNSGFNFQYNYIERDNNNIELEEKTYKIVFNLHF